MKKFLALSLSLLMLFSFCFTSQAYTVWDLGTDTSATPVDEMKNSKWKCLGLDYPNLVGDTASMKQIMSKHKARVDLLFYNLNLPAEYTVTEAYRDSSGGVYLFLTDISGQTYFVDLDDSGILDYYNASRVTAPTESFKKTYPNKEWMWEDITGYLVGTVSLAENKAVPGNAFLPLANIQLTTEVKVGNKLTDCQNIVAVGEVGDYLYNGMVNGEWWNSILNCIADCTVPGDAVAVKFLGDLETYKIGRGIRVNYVRWDGRLCQEYSVLIDKDYDNTERWKQRFSDSQIVAMPNEFISNAAFTDWSYLLPKGSYYPKNGIMSYPRIDLDFRKNSESK